MEYKYDRDKLRLVYTQIVLVIFEPPCNTVYCVKQTRAYGKHGEGRGKAVPAHAMKAYRGSVAQLRAFLNLGIK